MSSVILNNISKMYRIYNNPYDKLKEALIRTIFRRRTSFHREFWALQGMNLEVNKGMTLGIIGQNGSGKSTLLQIISGILQPTGGTVKVEGRVSALLELGAGFNAEFTGRENAFMNGSIMGISQDEMKQRFDQIAEFADIGDFIDQPIKTYSSGMYVRLAFAVAINVDPDILIVDEALAVGDIMFQNRCYRKMEEIQKMGKTIIFVSHDIQTVRSFCNYAVLIDRGRVVEEGTPNDVVNEYSRLLAIREEEYLNRVSKVGTTNNIQKMESSTSTEYRYGRGDAELVEFQIVDEKGHNTAVLQHGESYTIRSTAYFYRDVKDPMMGMDIKTLKGFIITAISTHSAEIRIGHVQSGAKVTVEFNLSMRLNPGEYTLCLGVSENTETHIRPLDRRVDVIIFKVIGKSLSFGPVDVGTTVKVVREEITQGALIQHLGSDLQNT